MFSLYRRPTEFTRNIGSHCLCTRASCVVVCALNTFTTCTVCRQLCRAVFCAACAAPNVDIYAIKKKIEVLDRLLFFWWFFAVSTTDMGSWQKKKKNMLACFLFILLGFYTGWVLGECSFHDLRHAWGYCIISSVSSSLPLECFFAR